MTRLRRSLTLAAGLALVGCGRPEQAAPAETPLTVEQWKALPAPSKYEIDTLERLKQGAPQLQEPRGWDKFTRDVLMPAKKKDQTTRPTP